MKRFTHWIVSFALAALVVGCAGKDNEPPGGLVAQLGGPSSAAKGAVHIFDYRDGIQVQLSMSNLLPGAYRIAIHEVGNCKSPNLFSAGPAWAPPGWTKPAGELLPSFTVSESGNQNQYVAFVKGVRAEGPGGLRGKSVVVHYGDLVGEAFPGQPNNRMACGVLESNKASFL
jgi:Cu/Zn superoxide dismutase